MRRRVLLVAAVVLAAVVASGTTWALRQRATPRENLHDLPLRTVAELPLGGGSSRFDYLSLDTARNRLYLAHLGAGIVTVVDTAQRQVLADIHDVPAVHGVLVVPELGRVFASATGAGQLDTLDEATYRVLAHTPAGRYPDGIAYDPDDHKLYVSDETGGVETVVDPASGQATGTVQLGGEAGNVQYNPGGHRVLVDVQSRNELAVIDPTSQQVVRRVRLAGCDHDHGLLVDPAHRLGFVACDGNARLLVVDLQTMTVTDRQRVGAKPDVLALDGSLGRLYVAAESGTVTVFTEQGKTLRRLGQGVIPHAHAVAVDARTHLVYLPLEGTGGHPVLRIMSPTGGS